MAGVGDEPVGVMGRPRRSAARPKRCWSDDDEGDVAGNALAAPPPDAASFATERAATWTARSRPRTSLMV